MRVQNTVLDELVRNQTYESIRFNNKDVINIQLLPGLSFSVILDH